MIMLDIQCDQMARKINLPTTPTPILMALYVHGLVPQLCYVEEIIIHTAF